MFRKVMVFGTFDPVHQGHLNYFEQAKKEGNFLIVVIARDKTVIKEKGRELLESEKERLKKVRELKIVDRAILGDLKDKLKVVKEENPEVICLGYDQKVDLKELRKNLRKLGLKPEIKTMKPFKQEKYKSSILREKQEFVSK